MKNVRLLLVWIFTLFLTTPPLFAHDTKQLQATIKSAKPSIVGIGIYQPLGAPRHQLRGTGFVIKSTNNSSLIVTNHHVIDGHEFSLNQNKVSVFVGEGNQVKNYTAVVLGFEEKFDIAILEINAVLVPMSLTTHKRPKPDGTPVISIGLPIGNVLGFYKSTHMGITSAYVPLAIPQVSGRTLTPDIIRQLKNPSYTYQLDLTAFPGNSGSPIIDADSGQVIAILNSVKVKTTKENLLSDPSGISYAIPIKHVQELLNRI